jgi:hypothetical protein
VGASRDCALALEALGELHREMSLLGYTLSSVVIHYYRDSDYTSCL